MTGELQSTDPVKTCEYCGTSNEVSLTTCAVCGKDLPRLPAVAPNAIPKMLGPEAPVLTARRANKILLIYIAAQLLSGLLSGILLGASSGGGISPSASAFSAMMLLVLLTSGLAVYRSSIKLLPLQLRDRTPTGAAWVLGSSRNICFGLLIGILLGVCYFAVALLFAPRGTAPSLGPIARMAVTPGLPQVVWLLSALLLAPPIEEALFRGVLFGGYAYSYGPVRATIFTTIIFSLLHLGEAIHFLPSLIIIAAVGLGAVWLRLRSSAIGPAIAVHLGYNGMLGLAVLLGSFGAYQNQPAP